MSSTDFLREVDGGVFIYIKAKPNAKKTQVCKVVQDEYGKSYLMIRIAAKPQDGLANIALKKFLAKYYKIPQTSLELTLGASSSYKQFFAANLKIKDLK